jgi:hypothetical protein
MIRILGMMSTVWVGVLLLAGIPSSGSAAPGGPVFDSNSSGLITFSSEDSVIRVAAVFAQKDDAVVPTLVRFLDARGNVLKQQRGELRDGQPLVVELTRRDVGTTTDVLVRIEVVHKLPTVRDHPYPIVVTTQPISVGGSGRFVLDWGTGHCGCPACGPPAGGGRHVACQPPAFADL